MKLNVRKSENVSILEISGKMIHPEATQLLRSKVKGLLEEGERVFILDMAKVPWMDSSSIGEVVACRNRIVAAEGKVRAVLDTEVHGMFTLFELQRVLKYYRSLEKALASLVEKEPVGPVES